MAATPEKAILLLLQEETLSKGDQKKLDILEATLRVICTEGIEELSFAVVGKAAGLHKAHVNYYFKDKPTLILDTLFYVTLKAQKYAVARLQKSSKPEVLLKNYIEATLDWSVSHPQEITTALLILYYCRMNASLQAQHSEYRRMSRERLSALLKPLCGADTAANFRTKLNAAFFLIAGSVTESTTNSLFTNLSQLKNDVYKGVLLICKAKPASKQ